MFLSFFPHFVAMRAVSWELRNTFYFRRWNCWLFTGSISQAKRHRKSIPKFIGHCAILAWSPGLSFHRTTGRFMCDPRPWMTFHIVYIYMCVCFSCEDIGDETSCLLVFSTAKEDAVAEKMRGQLRTKTSKYIAMSYYNGIYIVVIATIINIIVSYCFYDWQLCLLLIFTIISVPCHVHLPQALPLPKAGEIDVNRLVRNSGAPWHGWHGVEARRWDVLPLVDLGNFCDSSVWIHSEIIYDNMFKDG